MVKENQRCIKKGWTGLSYSMRTNGKGGGEKKSGPYYWGNWWEKKRGLILKLFGWKNHKRGKLITTQKTRGRETGKGSQQQNINRYMGKEGQNCGHWGSGTDKSGRPRRNKTPHRMHTGSLLSLRGNLTRGEIQGG